MSCFLSEILLPEDSDSLLWAYCQNCRCRKECPYIYNQVLRRAARQGRATAQRLTAEADRLLKTISCADDVCRLLNGDEVLERALSYALCSEMNLMDDLRAQTMKHRP